MLTRSLSLERQSLHQTTYFISSHSKALRIQLSTHSAAAISRIHFSVYLPHSRVKLHRHDINRLLFKSPIVVTAGMADVLANTGNSEARLLQLERDDLLLACISMAKKASEYSTSQRNTYT